MPTDLTTIGAALRKARRATGLSQIQLSEKLGITQGTISRAEAGRDSRAGTLLEIARALDHELIVIPRRLRSTVEAIVANTSSSKPRGAVYTVAGDELYDEGDAEAPP